MILQQSELLVQKAAEAESLAQLAQDRDKLDHRLRLLQKYATRLLASTRSLQVLRDAEIAPTTFDLQDQPARDMLRSTMTEFAQNPTVLLEDEKFNALVTALDTSTAKVEQHVRNQWTAYTRRTLPSIQDDVLAALRRIPAFEGSVGRLRTLQLTMSRCQSALPTSSQDLSTYQNAVNETVQTWQSLSSADLTPEVLTFLREAGTDGASLESYTDVVQAWLRDHDIMDAFRIRVSG